VVLLKGHIQNQVLPWGKLTMITLCVALLLHPDVGKKPKISMIGATPNYRGVGKKA
jgi:hypothetical protein